MTATPQDRVERLYRAHPLIEDIAVFEITPCVALVISHVSERDLRGVLDEIASRSPDCPRIVEFVALAPGDPLIPPLFTATGQRRDLIWEILVGCLEILTFVPEPTYAPARPPRDYRSAINLHTPGVD